MRWYPTNAKQVVDRLINDPHYRIRMAVENNPKLVRLNYQRSLNTQRHIPDGELVLKLCKLWDQGYEKAVYRIIDVPWVRGYDHLLDQAWDDMHLEVDAERSNEEVQKFVGFSGNDWLGIGALAGALSTIGGGRRAAEAAAAERERLRLMGELNAEENAAKAARQKRLLAYGAGALGIILLIALLLWKLRQQ